MQRRMRRRLDLTRAGGNQRFKVSFDVEQIDTPGGAPPLLLNGIAVRGEPDPDGLCIVIALAGEASPDLENPNAALPMAHIEGDAHHETGNEARAHDAHLARD